MKLIKELIVVILAVLFIGSCSSPELDGTEKTESEGSVETEMSQESFSIEGKAACDILSKEAVAQAFDFSADDITTETYRDKDDQKVCRYEMCFSKDKMAALIVAISYNDRQDVNPNEYSDELAKALSDGLPIQGFKDRIQEFDEVKNVGTQAAYSGNMPDNKNLIFRINEDYFVRLEYSRYEDGKDIGDLKGELTELARALLK